jgi:hypothetical protein
VLEGRAGRSYALRVRTPRGLGGAPGVIVKKATERDWELQVSFEGKTDDYVRRQLELPLR